MKIADDGASIAKRLKEIEEVKRAVQEPVEAPAEVDWSNVYGNSTYSGLASYALMGDTIYVFRDGKVYSTPSYL